MACHEDDPELRRLDALCEGLLRLWSEADRAYTLDPTPQNGRTLAELKDQATSCASRLLSRHRELCRHAGRRYGLRPGPGARRIRRPRAHGR
jgi:hypothetical protein